MADAIETTSDPVADDAKALADLEAEEAALKLSADLKSSDPEKNKAAQLAALKANEDKVRANMQTAQAAREALKPKPRRMPIGVINLDEQAQAQTLPEGAKPFAFFIGEIGLLKFADGSKYHVRSNHVTTYDQKLADKLTEASKNKALKIFPE
jgi:hypothetical protein